MLSEQDWEEIETHAQEEWAKTNDVTPHDDSLGFYSYGDASPAVGGGVGCFTWFDGPDAMLKFIQNVLPFCPPGPASKDHLLTQGDVKALIEAHLAGKSTFEELRLKLNKVLKSYSQIEWIGSFRELRTGTGEFAVELIRSFRDDDDEEGSDVIPVEAEEVPHFIDFLGEYGL